jgi:hypothetical protein
MSSRLYAGVMIQQLASGGLYWAPNMRGAHMLTLHGRILDIEVIRVAL